MCNETIANKVLTVLRENSYQEEADLLESLLERAESGDLSVSRDAREGIKGLCTVQSYGNLSISTMNGWAWNTLLDKLKKRISKNSG